MNINKAHLLGNLTRDPELRYTPSGTAVADLRLAVNRNYTSNGEKREEVLFIGVVVWGKTAEACGEYLKKGSQVYVEGRITSRDWESKDGQKRTTVEIVAESVQFGAKPKDSADRHEQEQERAQRPAGGTAQRPTTSRPAPAEIHSGGEGDDEVPF
jgi:single-strand DNA-binding protein